METNTVAFIGAGIAAASAIGTIAFNFWSFRRAESLKAEAAIKLEIEKKVYTELQPLLFQLSEAAEGGFHAVTSLARQQRNSKLPDALVHDGYYVRSICYRLLLPLTYLRLMQTSTSLIDHDRNPVIHLQYRLIKHCFITFTDPYGIAMNGGTPLQYEPAPENSSIETLGNSRQGMLILRLEALIDALIIREEGRRRPMNFGEFEEAISSNLFVKRYYSDIEDIIEGFDLNRRPVTGRILLAYASLTEILMQLYKKNSCGKSVKELGVEFIHSNEAKVFFDLDNSGSAAELVSLEGYLTSRFEQIDSPWGYALN